MVDNIFNELFWIGYWGHQYKCYRELRSLSIEPNNFSSNYIFFIKKIITHFKIVSCLVVWKYVEHAMWVSESSTPRPT